MKIDKQDFLNRCDAGLQLIGIDEDGEMEWIGGDKNWTLFSWLEDSVYADLSPEDRASIISEYLTN